MRHCLKTSQSSSYLIQVNNGQSYLPSSPGSRVSRREPGDESKSYLLKNNLLPATNTTWSCSLKIQHSALPKITLSHRLMIFSRSYSYKQPPVLCHLMPLSLTHCMVEFFQDLATRNQPQCSVIYCLSHTLTY